MRRIERTGPRTWTLLDEGGRMQGTKVQPSLWNARVELLLNKGLYTVKRLHLLSGVLSVCFGDTPVLEARFKLNRTVIQDPASGAPVLTVQKKHWFSSEHLLTDAQGTVRATIGTSVQWTRLRIEQQLLEEHGAPLEPLVLLFALQCIQVQQNRAAAGAAN
jgi:hypothetical protein